MNRLSRIYRKQKGVTAIEYALLAAALTALLTAVAGQGSALDQAVRAKFTEIATQIQGSSDSGSGSN